MRDYENVFVHGDCIKFRVIGFFCAKDASEFLGQPSRILFFCEILECGNKPLTSPLFLVLAPQNNKLPPAFEIKCSGELILPLGEPILTTHDFTAKIEHKISTTTDPDNINCFCISNIEISGPSAPLPSPRSQSKPIRPGSSTSEEIEILAASIRAHLRLSPTSPPPPHPHPPQPSPPPAARPC